MLVGEFERQDCLLDPERSNDGKSACFIPGYSSQFHWSVCLFLTWCHAVLTTVALKSGSLRLVVFFFFKKKKVCQEEVAQPLLPALGSQISESEASSV